jgi:hypothetical protein
MYKIRLRLRPTLFAAFCLCLLIASVFLIVGDSSEATHHSTEIEILETATSTMPDRPLGSAPPTRQQQFETGRFEVSVVDKYGSPVSGAAVRLGSSFVTDTDETGAALLDGVPKNTVGVRPPDEDQFLLFPVTEADRTRGRKTVRLGAHAELDVQLFSPGSVAVREAEVQLFEGSTQVASGQSNSNGKIKFGGLRPGEHSVRATSFGLATLGPKGASESSFIDIRKGKNSLEVRMVEIYGLWVAFENAGPGPSELLRHFAQIHIRFPGGLQHIPSGLEELRSRVMERLEGSVPDPRHSLTYFKLGYLPWSRQVSSHDDLTTVMTASWPSSEPIRKRVKFSSLHKVPNLAPSYVRVPTPQRWGQIRVFSPYDVSVHLMKGERVTFRSMVVSTKKRGRIIPVPMGRYRVMPRSTLVSASRGVSVDVSGVGVTDVKVSDSESDGRSRTVVGFRPR